MRPTKLTFIHVFHNHSEHGFFGVINHNVSLTLIDELVEQSHRFFALDEAVKMRYAMSLGGRAWRGYFPLGGELTSGVPDWKTGLYIGEDLPDNDPRVERKLPLHGRNLLPKDDVMPQFQANIDEYMRQTTALGHYLMRAIAVNFDIFNVVRTLE